MDADALLAFAGRCVAPDPLPPLSDEARAQLVLLERQAWVGTLAEVGSPEREIFEAWVSGVRHALLTRCPCRSAEALAIQRAYEVAGLVPTPRRNG